LFNAGVFGKMHAVERVRMENWDREIKIDLRGTFLVARSVGERMAKRRHGTIVNVASAAGMTSGPIHAYTAGKGRRHSAHADARGGMGPRRRARQCRLAGIYQDATLCLQSIPG
jgi:NAD(P)-dependent dehydrogenase (short-subunit alcohol dehydrogenase family)